MSTSMNLFFPPLPSSSPHSQEQKTFKEKENDGGLERRIERMESGASWYRIEDYGRKNWGWKEVVLSSTGKTWERSTTSPFLFCLSLSLPSFFSPSFPKWTWWKEGKTETDLLCVLYEHGSYSSSSCYFGVRKTERDFSESCAAHFFRLPSNACPLTRLFQLSNIFEKKNFLFRLSSINPFRQSMSFFSSFSSTRVTLQLKWSNSRLKKTETSQHFTIELPYGQPARNQRIKISDICFNDKLRT